MSEENGVEVRVDIWLWRARFFKTRALAAAFVTGKGVRLTRHGQTRKIDKPGTRLLPGDVLTFYLRQGVETIEILDAGTRRGPASEAETLYRRHTPAP